ncbi:unnamed protein product, partial [Mesorhabditis spiculigera]
MGWGYGGWVVIYEVLRDEANIQLPEQPLTKDVGRHPSASASSSNSDGSQRRLIPFTDQVAAGPQFEGSFQPFPDDEDLEGSGDVFEELKDAITPGTQLTYPPSADRTNQEKAANPPAKVPEVAKSSPPHHFPSILLASSLVVLLIFP